MGEFDLEAALKVLAMYVLKQDQRGIAEWTKQILEHDADLRAAVRAADAAIEALTERFDRVHSCHANCRTCEENKAWTEPVREWREARAKCGEVT